jgi:hypothetical protein
MKKLGSERRVIVCGWVGGGEAIVVLKDLKARLAGDLRGLRAFYELSALSFQLSAFSSCMRRIPLQMRVGGRTHMKRSCAKGMTLPPQNVSHSELI